MLTLKKMIEQTITYFTIFDWTGFAKFVIAFSIVGISIILLTAVIRTIRQ